MVMTIFPTYSGYGVPETILCDLDSKVDITCIIDRELEKSAMAFKNLLLMEILVKKMML